MSSHHNNMHTTKSSFNLAMSCFLHALHYSPLIKAMGQDVSCNETPSPTSSLQLQLFSSNPSTNLRFSIWCNLGVLSPVSCPHYCTDWKILAVVQRQETPETYPHLFTSCILEPSTIYNTIECVLWYQYVKCALHELLTSIADAHGCIQSLTRHTR